MADQADSARSGILVTGKAGFLGQYVQGIGVDDRSRSNRAVDHWLDIRNTHALAELMRELKPDAVIHLAAFKDVEESYRIPEEYWSRNVGGTISLVEAMKGVCNRIVFASSAAIEGPSPYGATKWACEAFLRSVPWLNSAILRIFNPVGPGCSGLFANMLTGKVHLKSNGIRDYVAADEVGEALMLACNPATGSFTCDIGTGEGTSVEDAVQAFLWSGKRLEITRAKSRKLEIRSIADTNEAERILGWRARKDLKEIVATL